MKIERIKPADTYEALRRQFGALKQLYWFADRERQEFRQDQHLNFIATKTLESERAANAILTRENEVLRGLVECLLENDPQEPISDAGHVVLDLWRHEARLALATKVRTQR